MSRLVDASRALFARLVRRGAPVGEGGPALVDTAQPGPADPVLMATVLALVAFGVVMVYSASAVFASQIFHDGAHFLVRQALYAVAGLVLVVALARLDYHLLRPLAYPMLGASVLMMLYIAVGFGHSAGGAARWISLGPIHIQPAETAKITMIFWLAYSLSKKADRIRSFSVGFLPHALVAGFVMLLCLRQPDFGSAVMIALLTFVLLFTAGARTGYILGAGLLVAPIAYVLITRSEYRMRRIQAFLDPFAHRFDVGYQISESLMSFGSGGLSGVGIGDSRQKLFFLPEAHTDFISAIVGEELGFVGIVATMLAFAIVVLRGLRAAFRAADDYGTYLAVGLTLFIGIQAFTNLAVTMGLVPTKGLALPFLSFGGSSLLVNCAAIGVLLNVSRARPERAQPPRESGSTPARNTTTNGPRGGSLRPAAAAGATI